MHNLNYFALNLNNHQPLRLIEYHLFVSKFLAHLFRKPIPRVLNEALGVMFIFGLRILLTFIFAPVDLRFCLVKIDLVINFDLIFNQLNKFSRFVFYRY